MLQDPRVEKMAEVLVQYALGVQPGWQVGISTTPLALPLVAAVYAQVLGAQAHPAVLLQVPELDRIVLERADDDQLANVTPFGRILWDAFDALLLIHADENTRANSGIAPERLARQQQAARRYNRGMAWREAGRPYCLTQFPTQAFAQDAGMSLRDYENFVFRACMLDAPDPIAAWRALGTMQQRLVDWLQGRQEVHVVGPDIDLTLSIAGRTFLNSDGHHNFPSGEIFTGPVEHSVTGHIAFSYPAHYRGRIVERVHLWFEEGRVARFEAGAGADFLGVMLDLDPGARRLGEFAIGTNRGVDRFTGSVLFDEKMAGTIHCALGESYAQTGGTNHSAIHWDMVADMREGRITVDGDLFYENGAFVI